MTGAADDAVDDIVRRALAEDAPWGDVTSENVLPPGVSARAALVAREPGVFSGADVLGRVFEHVDPDLDVSVLRGDGEPFEAGSVLARIHGDARSMLRAERVALNLVQRMCGIASETQRYVAAVARSHARIVDTRKTMPGLRVLDRRAVRDGGGRNHRSSLSDAVLVKDNHLAVLAAAGIAPADAIRGIRHRVGHTVHVEVEVDRLEQIESALSAGVDTILLDNFSLPDLAQGVRIVAGRALVEASGGVTLDSVGAIAATGVDLISVGALTHSVRALDLGLDIGVAR